MGHRYRQMDVGTATPQALVYKLLDRACLHLRTLSEGPPPAPAARCQGLSRVLAIVGELRSVLDMEQGGEISRNLDALYDFVADRVLEANRSGSNEGVAEARRVLEPLADAWREISTSASVAGPRP